MLKLCDIEESYAYVHFGDEYSNTAYISKLTGKTYWHSEFGDNEEELPENIDENDEYAVIPSKRDLDLGQTLVFRFMRKVAPDKEGQVSNYFSKRGAYARFRDFLERNNLLQKWYDFEDEQTKSALIAWCESNGIKLVAD